MTPGATTLVVNGPTVDLGSDTVNRTILVELRAVSTSGTGTLDIWFSDSSTGTTFVTMPSSAGNRLGFGRITGGNTISYSSTDAVAANAPFRITLRTDKRYVRASWQASETTVSIQGVSIVGVPMEGAYAGAVGPRDV